MSWAPILRRCAIGSLRPCGTKLRPGLWLDTYHFQDMVGSGMDTAESIIRTPVCENRLVGLK